MHDGNVEIIKKAPDFSGAFFMHTLFIFYFLKATIVALLIAETILHCHRLILQDKFH